MPKEIQLADREHYLNAIAQDYLLKGVNNATRISKELGIPRKEVLDYIDDIRASWNNGDAKERAKELLDEMDKGYDQIIAEFWILHAEAVEVKDKNAILKNISEVIAKRQDVLQKAGLYDDAAIGDELALVEEQMAGIRNLLKKVSEKYGKSNPELRKDIMDGLGEIFKQPTSIPVSGEVTGPVA